jgi:uncharacterized protein (TIGR02145 family)
MRNKIIVFVMLINFSFLLAQNNAPEVTNVTFNQRTDGSFKVDIYYDLNDADDDTMFVSMQVSDDAGSSWGFSCALDSGDIGAGKTSGIGKHIMWDFGAEHPNTSGNNFLIKIISNDWFLITGTLTDIDGNVYQTVKIGEQWWMAENLKVKKYRNGDPIPNVTDNTAWTGLTTGAWCSYNNDAGNIETYGLLYNWYAVDDSRNIAPAGWHVPTDAEFTALENYLIANGYNWDGTTTGNKIGKSLASKTGWNSSSYAGVVGNDMPTNNTSGFSALPGGYRDFNYGAYYYMGSKGYWWSASANFSSYAWYRGLHYDGYGVFRYYGNRRYGFSVRLVRD